MASLENKLDVVMEGGSAPSLPKDEDAMVEQQNPVEPPKPGDDAPPRARNEVPSPRASDTDPSPQVPPVASPPPPPSRDSRPPSGLDLLAKGERKKKGDTTPAGDSRGESDERMVTPPSSPTLPVFSPPAPQTPPKSAFKRKRLKVVPDIDDCAPKTPVSIQPPSPAPSLGSLRGAAGEDKKEKEALLFRLYALRKRGAPVSKKYTMDSSIEEMKEEYRVLKHQIDVKASRAFSAKMLVMIVTALEFLNDRYDPFDVYLDGWSESVHENIGDYDEVFDQLYEKYREKVEVAPEVKLMLMLGGSAFMFHMTNSMFRPTVVPGMENIEPQAVKQMMSAAKKEMDRGMPVQHKSLKKSVQFGEMHARAAPPKRSPPPIPPTQAPMDQGTVDDILRYITEEPKPMSSRMDDARSESTMVSVVTTGGTRRRKKKKRTMALTL